MLPINEKIKKLIEKNAMALSTVGEDGNPHCIAIALVQVVSSSQLLITDNYLIITPENIKRNKNVAIAVWERNWEEDCVGYELKGEAEYFTEGEWVERIKRIPENNGEPCKGALLVTVNNIKRLA
ncbi:MAG: pyridoxamine 5'-phosphate oxidase family protein [Candidatus Falkowbacteria bacterium]